MSARALQHELRALAQRHGVSPQRPRHVPLTDPVDSPLILSGYASTPTLDCDRIRFAPHAFGRLPPVLPLLLEHGSAAGSIEALSYAPNGALMIRCIATHPTARRCGAFSVAARIRAYTIHDADRPDFHAVVTRAELVEISLTQYARNPAALVTARRRPTPQAELYDGVLASLARMQEQLHAIRIG